MYMLQEHASRRENHSGQQKPFQQTGFHRQEQQKQGGGMAAEKEVVYDECTHVCSQGRDRIRKRDDGRQRLQGNQEKRDGAQARQYGRSLKPYNESGRVLGKCVYAQEK